jgi:hypothetical protein
MMNRIVSVSVAQLRMLGRSIRGEVLPTSRYRLQQPTVKALQRKGLWSMQCRVDTHTMRALEETHWAPTELGRRVHAAHGKLYLTKPEEKPDTEWVQRLLRPRRRS